MECSFSPKNFIIESFGLDIDGSTVKDAPEHPSAQMTVVQRGSLGKCSIDNIMERKIACYVDISIIMPRNSTAPF
jgi:hypothetical protein